MLSPAQYSLTNAESWPEKPFNIISSASRQQGLTTSHFYTQLDPIALQLTISNLPLPLNYIIVSDQFQFPRKQAFLHTFQASKPVFHGLVAMHLAVAN